MKKIETFTKEFHYLKANDLKRHFDNDEVFRRKIKKYCLPHILRKSIDEKEIVYVFIEGMVSFQSLWVKAISQNKITESTSILKDIMEIRDELITNNVLHGDLVLHNIFKKNDIIILIDNFPPKALPRRYNYLTIQLESCFLMFNLISALSLNDTKSHKNNIKALLGLYYQKYKHDITLINIFKSTVEYAYINFKSRKFKTAIFKSLYLISIILIVKVNANK